MLKCKNNWLISITTFGKTIGNINLTIILRLLLSADTKCHDCTNSLTSHSQTQSSRQRWVEHHYQLQTCSPVETTWRRWRLGWSWGWPEWASTPPPFGTTHRHYGLLHMSLYGHFWEPSQYLQHAIETKTNYYKKRLCNYKLLYRQIIQNHTRIKLVLMTVPEKLVLSVCGLVIKTQKRSE